MFSTGSNVSTIYDLIRASIRVAHTALILSFLSGQQPETRVLCSVKVSYEMNKLSITRPVFHSLTYSNNKILFMRINAIMRTTEPTSSTFVAAFKWVFNLQFKINYFRNHFRSVVSIKHNNQCVLIKTFFFACNKVFVSHSTAHL